MLSSYVLLVSRKETRGVSFETSENNDNNKEIISSNILMSIRIYARVTVTRLL